MADQEYVPTGSFANNGISGFKGYVKGGVLDWEKAKTDWALNDNQRPHLEAELVAAGFLSDAAPAADVSRVDTAPLEPIEETEEASE